MNENERKGQWVITKRDWKKHPLSDDEIKPCHELNFCPYGQLVECYPLYKKEKGLAIKNNKYVKWR